MSTPTNGGITYYVVPGYWVDGYTIDAPSPTPQVQQPVTVQEVIPSYLYWQYADDSDLQAFVASFNSMAQLYVNTFNQINLPIYAGDNLIVGDLLNWVAKGIYGVDRPILSFGSASAAGTYNSAVVPYNVVPYDFIKNFGSVTEIATTDDIFKRILTWNLYRGDGQIFSISWLKRRVRRFLEGLNGTDPGIDQTYQIAVTVNGNAFTIDVSAWATANPSSQMPSVLQDAINVGCLNLPFMYTYTVNA